MKATYAMRRPLYLDLTAEAADVPSDEQTSEPEAISDGALQEVVAAA